MTICASWLIDRFFSSKHTLTLLTLFPSSRYPHLLCYASNKTRVKHQSFLSFQSSLLSSGNRNTKHSQNQMHQHRTNLRLASPELLRPSFTLPFSPPLLKETLIGHDFCRNRMSKKKKKNQLKPEQNLESQSSLWCCRWLKFVWFFSSIMRTNGNHLHQPLLMTGQDLFWHSMCNWD